MIRTLLTLAFGIGVGLAATMAAHNDHHEGVNVTTLAARDIVEKLSGQEAKATFLGGDAGSRPGGHADRHTGPAFGYVLEGEFEWAIDDQPAQVLKAGETFYEPSGCLHRVAKNPAATGKTRILAVILHPRDAKQVTIPEPKNK